MNGIEICRHFASLTSWTCGNMYMWMNILKDGRCPFSLSEQGACCKFEPLPPLYENPNRIPKAK